MSTTGVPKGQYLQLGQGNMYSDGSLYYYIQWTSAVASASTFTLNSDGSLAIVGEKALYGTSTSTGTLVSSYVIVGDAGYATATYAKPLTCTINASTLAFTCKNGAFDTFWDCSNQLKYAQDGINDSNYCYTQSSKTTFKAVAA